MKKIILYLFILCLSFTSARSQRHIVVNTTGYGFDPSQTSGIESTFIPYLNSLANLTSSTGQDASVTCVRFYVDWTKYEPTLGDYKWQKLRDAVDYILALKPNMKIALHFPFQRGAVGVDNYFSTDELARIQENNTIVGDNVYTDPSIFSSLAKTRFYAFVDNALSHLTDKFSNIVFITMGNNHAEEFSIPALVRNNGQYDRNVPGYFETRATEAFRNEYLPCRFPGQSTVTISGVSKTVATAVPDPPKSNDEFNTPWGMESHRFVSWGLMKLYKGFRDIVKARSSSLQVLYFIADFGSKQGNLGYMHNATIPMAMQEFDGIYTSVGDDPNNINEKIMALDAIKGTNPSKKAVIEFDPLDFGEVGSQGSATLTQPNLATDFFPRAFKHGADYICLAQFFQPTEVNQIKQALANTKATYVTASYTPPSRQTAQTVNIHPGVFEEYGLFMPNWNAQNGSNWASTDVSPKSINMTDVNYWQNLWSCSGTPDPCAFTISITPSSSTPTVNTSVTLTPSCSGQCSGVTYSWSGNGISGSENPKVFNAPASAGQYTYTLTASKSGCTNKTQNITLDVQPNGGGGTTTCTGTIDLCSGNTSEIRSGTVNVSGAGTYSIKLTSRSHEGPATGRIRFNGGSWSNYSLPQTGVNEYIETTLGNFTLNNGNNTVDLSSNGGFICFRKVCATGGSGCSTPAAPTLTASPSTINAGSSSTLTASGCSGGTITWSNGLGTGSSKTVSPTSTTTYTANCSIGSCVSSNGSTTVTVNTSGVSCNQLQGFFDVVNCDVIAGWIWDGGHPNDVVYVDLYEGSTLIQGNIAANIFRQDLLNAGKGNGVHGYSIATPATLKNGQNRTLTMKQTACNYTLEWAPKTINCSGGSAVLGTVNPDEINRIKGIQISPNPNKGIFETDFYLEKGKKATLTVVDLQGRVIYNRSITGQGVHREKINLLNKASGTLLLQLHKDNGIETKKINIAR